MRALDMPDDEDDYDAIMAAMDDPLDDPLNGGQDEGEDNDMEDPPYDPVTPEDA